MDGRSVSLVLSGSVLGLINDPITKDLQESQSKFINARRIALVASKDESSFCVFRDGLMSVNLLKRQEITKVVTDRGHAMYQAVVVLFLNITILKQISDFVFQNLIEAIMLS